MSKIDDVTHDPTMRAFQAFALPSGVIVCLCIYGQLQERIMSHEYEGEKFNSAMFLVTCNRIFAVIVAVVMAKSYREPLKAKAPIWKYAVVSIANVYASTCQYESLRYVTFAVQMLGKSFKMMPVMLWGMVISRKSYNRTDWVVAFLVTVGCAEFLMTGPTSASESESTLWGYVLLALFLVFDGLTSTMQEKLFRDHDTSKYNQMIYINLLSTIIGTMTLVAERNLLYSLRFCASHGYFMRDNLVLSASAVGGQFFIYSEVKEFGALAFAATMNLRQIASIILSYITYHHRITGLQMLGLAIAFSALFYKVYLGFTEEQTKTDAQIKMDAEKGKTENDDLLPEGDNVKNVGIYKSTYKNEANA